jgi:hypothetical protein
MVWKTAACFSAITTIAFASPGHSNFAGVVIMPGSLLGTFANKKGGFFAGIGQTKIGQEVLLCTKTVLATRRPEINKRLKKTICVI